MSSPNQEDKEDATNDETHNATIKIRIPRLKGGEGEKRAEENPTTVIKVKEESICKWRLKLLFRGQIPTCIVHFFTTTLISKYTCKGRFRPHPQNVNIKRRLQTQSGGWGRIGGAIRAEGTLIRKMSQ